MKSSVRLVQQTWNVRNMKDEEIWWFEDGP